MHGEHTRVTHSETIRLKKSGNVTQSSQSVANHATSLVRLPSTPCSATPREREKLASDPLLAQGSGRNIEEGRRERVAIATLWCVLLASCWRWRSMLASARQRGIPFLPESSSRHLPRQPAEPLGSQWGEHFKLTDVFEFGRPCIRLRLGFMGQVLESGGSVMVRGGRGLLLLP